MNTPTEAEILATLKAAGLDAVERAADKSRYPTAEAASLLTWLTDRGLSLEEQEDWRETEDGTDEVCTGVTYWVSQGEKAILSVESSDLV